MGSLYYDICQVRLRNDSVKGKINNNSQIDRDNESKFNLN